MVDIDGTAQLLVGQIEAVESALNAEMRDILGDPRWQYRVGRIRNLLAETEAAKDDIIRAGQKWVNGPFREAYAQSATEAGARIGSAFEWTQFHREGFTMLAQDTFSDVLDATTYMDRDAKTLIRQLGQARAAQGEIAGRTALQSAALLRDDLLANGMKAVTYRNGARYGVGTFSRMLMRTKTALARNLGSMIQYREGGVEVVEIVDGQNCGLTTHHDPERADGLILPIGEASQYPLSHPNCVRDFLPRPDVRAADTGRAESLVEQDRWEDQRRFESYLDRERITREGRIQARTPRSHRTERLPRSKRLPREALSRTNLRGRTPTPQELIDLDLDFVRERYAVVEPVTPPPPPPPPADPPSLYEKMRQWMRGDDTVAAADIEVEWKGQYERSYMAELARPLDEVGPKFLTGKSQYQSADGPRINAALRKADGVVDDIPANAKAGAGKQTIRETVEALDDGMAPSTEEMTLFRSLPADAVGDVKVGQVVTDHGYLSTTSNLTKPSNFGDVGFIIKAPEGTRMINIDAVSKAPFRIGNEAELLLPRGTRLVVDEIIDTVDGSYWGQKDRVYVMRVLDEADDVLDPAALARIADESEDFITAVNASRPGDRFRGTGTWLDDIADDYDLIQTSNRDTWRQSQYRGDLELPGPELRDAQAAIHRVGERVNDEVERRAVKLGIADTQEAKAALRLVAEAQEEAEQANRYRRQIDRDVGSYAGKKDDLTRLRNKVARTVDDAADIVPPKYIEDFIDEAPEAWAEAARTNAALRDIQNISKAELNNALRYVIDDLDELVKASTLDLDDAIEKLATKTAARDAAQEAYDKLRAASPAGKARREILDLAARDQQLMRDGLHAGRDAQEMDRLAQYLKATAKDGTVDLVDMIQGTGEATTKSLRQAFWEFADDVPGVGRTLAKHNIDVDDLLLMSIDDALATLDAAAEKAAENTRLWKNQRAGIKAEIARLEAALPKIGDIRLEVLSEIREFGTEKLLYRLDESIGSVEWAKTIEEIDDAIEEANRFYPADWVRALNDKNAGFDAPGVKMIQELDPDHYGKRAYFRAGEGRVPDAINVGGGEVDAMLHEFVHGMDRAVPGMQENAWAKVVTRYDDATGGITTKPMRSQAEMSKIYKDTASLKKYEHKSYVTEPDFGRKYIGRLYPEYGPNSPRWETNTMGFEGYFTADADGLGVFGEGPLTQRVGGFDSDFLNYIAGVLALL